MRKRMTFTADGVLVCCEEGDCNEHNSDTAVAQFDWAYGRDVMNSFSWEWRESRKWLIVFDLFSDCL